MISLVTRGYYNCFSFIDTDSGKPKTEPFSQRKRIKAYLFEINTEIKAIIPRANQVKKRTRPILRYMTKKE